MAMIASSDIPLATPRAVSASSIHVSIALASAISNRQWLPTVVTDSGYRQWLPTVATDKVTPMPRSLIYTIILENGLYLRTQHLVRCFH
jgi:hypothetical protein